MKRFLALLLMTGCAGTRLVWPPAGVCRVPTLTVSYRADNRCAPLYAACLRGAEFRQRYGLWLQPLKPREHYALISGCRRLIDIRLESQPGDKRVAERLAFGDIPLGILSPEDVMRAQLESMPVHIIAPLQSGGDMLIISADLPIDSWSSFTDYLRRLTRPLRLAYVPREPNCLLAFEQALEYENLADKVILYRLVDYTPLVQNLTSGAIDGAVLSNPVAWEIAATTNSRIVCQLNDLPPNRFENCPSTVIAAHDSAMHADQTAIGHFLEMMACATHYANERTIDTRAATQQWLNTSREEESAAFSTYRFSSLPDWYFRTGLWNWFFALRLKNQVPSRFASIMEIDDWYHICYDSSLVIPALERAGRRIIR